MARNVAAEQHLVNSLFITSKGQVKLSLCICHECMGAGEGIAPLLLNIGTRWDEWSASHADHFMLGGPNTYILEASILMCPI